MSARKLKVKGRFKKKVKRRQFPTEEGIFWCAPKEIKISISLCAPLGLRETVKPKCSNTPPPPPKDSRQKGRLFYSQI